MNRVGSCTLIFMKDYEKGVKLMESVTFGTELIGLSFTFLVRFSTVS